MQPTEATPGENGAADVGEHRGRAMGTNIHVIVHGGNARRLAAHAVRSIADLERRWSRFDPASDVSKLNERAGSFVEVSPTTIELVSRSLDAWHLTSGRFDPTMEREMIRLGYDRNYDDVRIGDSRTAAPIGQHASSDRGDASRSKTPSAPRSSVCDAIAIDVGRSSVRLPEHVGFDPGGIGKGLAADLVTDAIMRDGARGVMVNLGGDLRVRGDAPGASAWVVTVREPSIRPDAFTTVALNEGAIATSTTRRRRWDGAARDDTHHVLDPATGQPHHETEGHAVLATAIARDGWWAEAAATASIGRQVPGESAADLRAETLRVFGDESEVRTDGFSSYER